MEASVVDKIDMYKHCGVKCLVRGNKRPIEFVKVSPCRKQAILRTKKNVTYREDIRDIKLLLIDPLEVDVKTWKSIFKEITSYNIESVIIDECEIMATTKKSGIFYFNTKTTEFSPARIDTLMSASIAMSSGIDIYGLLKAHQADE